MSAPYIITQPGRQIETELRPEEGHKAEQADMILAKRAADKLHNHYPGHLWAVNVNSEGGVMVVKNMNVSFLYGYVLHLTTVYADPGLRCVMRAGGEILERAHMAHRYQGGQAQIVEGVLDHHQPKPGIII